MSGERRFSRAHGPDMEVMNLSHTGALSQIGLNSKRLNPRRHGIKRKVYRISKELPRPGTTTTATMIKLTTGSNHNQSVAIMAMPARTTPVTPHQRPCAGTRHGCLSRPFGPT